MTSKTASPPTTEEYHMPVTLKRRGALPPPPQAALCKALKASHVTVQWLAGDGSDRCYYRLKLKDPAQSYVLMQLSGRDALALEEGGYEWIEMAKILQAQNIVTPKVICTLPKYAALIIEDYGNLMLEGLFKKSPGLSGPNRKFYRSALDMSIKLLLIKKNPDDIWCQRSFDEERLRWELNFFKDKYLAPIAAINLSEQESLIFQKESTLLSKFLSQYSDYFIHRDFHSRNLMVEGDHLALIDFQDARLGPPAYDIVSIIFDSYVDLSHEDRLQLLTYAIDQVSTHLGQQHADIIKNTWKATLLQRLLKAIGSFGFLTLEKNRGDYLKYVSPAVKILLECDVIDSRWNFISNTLIAKINNQLGQGTREQ
jgi:aminoglycoside/choline kinase family phosphotransferase